jgi:glycosyltransferase involved in cell wall biosynthesis
MPSIAVVIPIWNRAHLVDKAIASVLSQDLPGYFIDVIVVDDGSTDALAEALRPFESRITCIRHEQNKGAAAARNTGIAHAKGDYLAFLDSDDVWLPNKLATQLAFMKQNGSVASCTACYLTRPGGSDVLWPRYKVTTLTHADLVWGCFLSPGTTMICEPRVFDEIGPFDPALQRHEDWDWLLRFTARYDLAYLATPLARREPSPYVNTGQALDVLDKMSAKHLSKLHVRERRHFEAAIAYDTAAAYFREGSRVSALRAMLKFLWLAPTGHAVLPGLLSRGFSR